MSPDGLVLGLLGQVLAVFVIVDARAADDAAAVAAVGGLAAAGDLGFGLGFAADLVARIKAAPHEVLGGVGPGFVDDIGQIIGNVTSGTMSPSLGKGIGLGYVPMAFTDIGSTISIQIRKKAIPATVVKLPFYKG